MTQAVPVDAQTQAPPAATKRAPWRIPARLVRLDTFGALRRHRNFRLFWTGAAVSNVGNWMQGLAQGWLVYQLTGSALLLGTVAFLQGLPVLVLSLVGGVLADRVERRTLMVATQSAQMLLAFLLAALTLTGVVRVEHVLVIAFVSGLVDALNSPVRMGLISDMVPPDDVQNAIAVNIAQFRASQFVGPAIAGIVVARVGAGWAFLLNGLSFATLLGALLSLRLPPWTPPAAKLSLWQSAKAGIAFVFGHEVLGTLVVIAAVPALCAGGLQALMPVFAASVLDVGAEGLGALLGAMGGGALLGALVAASLSTFRRRGLLQLGAGIAYGVALLLFAASRNLELSLALLFVGSACIMVFSSLNQTFLQTLAPDHMRGRVLSVMTVTTFGLLPLGGLAAGAAAQRWDASLVVGAGGAACALCTLAALITRPRHRRLA
jgi:MFS family permease